MRRSGHSLSGGSRIDILTVLIAARWIHFASLSVVVGSAAFLLLVPVDRRLAGQALPPRTSNALGVVAALSGAAWLAGTIASVAGPGAPLDPELLRVFFLETPFGPPSALRAALLAALFVVSLLPRRSRLASSATLAIGSVLLVSQAWVGHAAEGGRYGGAMIVAYSVHVLAAAAWAGSLPALAFRVWRTRDDAASTGATLARYSLIAVPGAALVVLSGTANILFHAKGVGALVASTWGLVLASKLALVAAMLALAAFLRWSLLPRLRGHAAAGIANLAFVGVVTDAALALAVFGAAAILGLTPPPR